MLKVVVFDSGYGGEFFADKLEMEVPIIEIIRVIDWRHANQILENPKKARRVAIDALRPYIGKVDLIIIANHLLTISSLKYFNRKFKNQRFIGLNLKQPDTFIKRDVLILTTKAVTRTFNYYYYLFRIKRKTRTLVVDHWPAKIDDGELTEQEIRDTIEDFLVGKDFNPQEIVLACSQFNDIKDELRHVFGHNIKIFDSYDETIRRTCKVLRIRGGIGKKRKAKQYAKLNTKVKSRLSTSPRLAIAAKLKR